MITPDEILKRAERKQYEVLRWWLSGEGFTPIAIPVGALSKDLIKRRQQIEALQNQSREVCGTGYTLEWETINTHALGRQTIPRRIRIDTLADYLALIRKRTVFDRFVADVQKIRHKFPALESWLRLRPQDVIKHHGKWDDLLIICGYFVRTPRPNVYIRELPIPVHTKFIEGNERILSDLLEVLLPGESIDGQAQNFNARYGLRDKPSLIRVRLLEEQLDWLYGLSLDDLSMPVDQLTHLLKNHVKPKHVIIVENLINFLTLPKIPSGVGLFGGGFAVHLLRDVVWLNSCNVIYWGDIDAHGFEILSDLRGYFPHTRSLMMDRQTFDTYRQYVVSGKQVRSERYTHLTEEERLLAQDVVAHDWRLEQEHLPQDYVVARLKQLLLNPGLPPVF